MHYKELVQISVKKKKHLSRKMKQEHKQFTKEEIRVAIKCNLKHPVLLVIQKRAKQS